MLGMWCSNHPSLLRRLALVSTVLATLAFGACILQERTRSPSDDLPQTAAVPFSGDKFAWPAGKTAAVSLTYDDALRSQLDNAVPALNKHHLVGTFFLTELARQAPDGWRAVLTRGHELAAHTLLHPCDGAQSWVQKGRALQDYDAARMSAELDENIGLLKSLGSSKGPYTFAYPCGSTWIGSSQESYIPLVTKRFSAARGAGNRAIDPATETFENTAGVSADKSGDDLVGLVQEAEKQNRWVVLMFHGVGGDYLSTSTEAHEMLLAYLEGHANTIWTGTFGAIASYVQTHRPPLKTP
jgi:peptidoglycan/xylan/chitin deacetylase (PgdA/CDA1 family)